MRGTYQPFFITGLLRSRTGWLSNWLTYGRSFCWHDGFRWSARAELAESLGLLARDPEQWMDDALDGLPKLFRDTAYRMRLREGRQLGTGVLVGGRVYVGLSDPTCTAVWDCLRETFPSAPWVVIRRPVEDVARSCDGLVSIDWLRYQEELLEDCVLETQALVVPFDRIDSSLSLIGRHVMGDDYAANPQRDRQLKTWNIQIPLSGVKAAVAAAAAVEVEGLPVKLGDLTVADGHTTVES